MFSAVSWSTRVLDTDSRLDFVEISPDGKWVTYTSDEEGELEVYVESFPELGAGKWKVSIDGGTDSRWARDMSELYYRNDDAMMAVPIEEGDTFTPREPEELFRKPFVRGRGLVYDVAPDGRFIMRDRKILTVDEASLIAEADKVGRRVWSEVEAASPVTVPRLPRA